MPKPKKAKQTFLSGKSQSHRIEIDGIPQDYWPFVKVETMNPTSIRLGDWPENVYAGNWLAGYDERVKFLPRSGE